jgi:hypothetical protein
MKRSLVDASALVSGEILLAGRNPELGGSGKASGQFTSFSGWIADSGLFDNEALLESVRASLESRAQ